MAYTTSTAVIAQSGTVSTIVGIGGRTITDITCPACTGTSISLSECDTSTGTFIITCSDTAQVSFTVGAAARKVHLQPSGLFGIQFLKLTSNGAEAAERTFTITTVDVVS
jgi:hypothetical protein